MDLSLKNKFAISKRTFTPEGFLEVPAVLARAGIYEYHAMEIHNGVSDVNSLPPALRNKQPGDLVRVLYPDAVVTQSNLEYIPVTDDHPEQMVTSKNIREFQRGFVKSGVKKDGQLISGEVVIQDQSLIDKIEKKEAEELSTGVVGAINFTPGTSEQYGQFDMAYKSLHINHLAVVPAGRAGSNVRLANNQKEKVKTMDKKVLIDGVTFTFNEQSAEAVERLISKNAELTTTAKEASVALKNIQKEKDQISGEMKAMKAELEDVGALEAKADERAELINTAKGLVAELETAGKTNADIMREVVLTNSKVDVEKENDDVVAGIFKHMVANQVDEKPTGDDLSFLKNKKPAKKDEPKLSARNAWLKRTKKVSEGK